MLTWVLTPLSLPAAPRVGLTPKLKLLFTFFTAFTLFMATGCAPALAVASTSTSVFDFRFSETLSSPLLLSSFFFLLLLCVSLVRNLNREALRAFSSQNQRKPISESHAWKSSHLQFFRFLEFQKFPRNDFPRRYFKEERRRERRERCQPWRRWRWRISAMRRRRSGR